MYLQEKCKSGQIVNLRGHNLTNVWSPQCCQKASSPCCQKASSPCCQKASSPCCQKASSPCCQKASSPCCQKALSPCCQKATLCSILCQVSSNSYFLMTLFYLILETISFLFLSSFIPFFFYCTLHIFNTFGSIVAQWQQQETLLSNTIFY